MSRSDSNIEIKANVDFHKTAKNSTCLFYKVIYATMEKKRFVELS